MRVPCPLATLQPISPGAAMVHDGKVVDVQVAYAFGQQRVLSCFPASSQIDESALTLDLSRVTFCEPIGLVAAAAVMHSAAQGAGGRLIAPTNTDVLNYLSRVRLGSVLSNFGIPHDLPVVREHKQISVLELTSFSDAAGLEVLADHLFSLLKTKDSVSAAALHDCISEAGQNVIQHSRAAVGFFAAQLTHQGRRLRFAVGDAGVGLLANLSRREAADHQQALTLAVTPGVSSTDDSDRGYGFSAMRDVLTRHGGVLHLVSGNAHGAFGAAARTSSDPSSYFAGTLLQGELQSEHDLRIN